MRGPKRRFPIERFMAKICIDPLITFNGTPYWLWTGSVAYGYGKFKVESGLSPVTAQRFAYEYFKGKLPKGLEPDHLCRRRICANPDHLEAVTHAENMRRGDTGKHWAKRTHCRKQHPLSGDNLYIESTTGRRRCRACRRAWRKAAA